VGEVTATREVEPHDAVVWIKQSSVKRKVCWGAAVWLHINTPLLRIKSKCLQRTRLAQPLDLGIQAQATHIMISIKSEDASSLSGVV
jgi:hypothetical protein